MKQIFVVLALIYCIICDGPAKNVEDREEGSCESASAEGTSSCVDRSLYDSNKGRYYDKCCFLRYRANGEMGYSCIGVTSQEYFDIPEFINKLEEESSNMKIYELNCNSSYLKIFALSFALVSLLF